MLGKVVSYMEKNKTVPLFKTTHKIKKNTIIKSENVGKYICNLEECKGVFSKT